MPEEQNEELEIPENFSKVVLGLVAGVVVLGVVVYGAYSLSKKNGNTVLPSGFPAKQQPTQAKSLSTIDCTKETKPDPGNYWPYYIKCLPLRADASTKWVAFNDPMGFSFDLPESIKLAPPFPNGIGYNYHEIPASDNLIFSLDLAASRSGEFKSMTLDNYPENYWRQFSGLTAVKETTKFTNSKNINGVRAVYVNVNNESPSVDVFFEFPEKRGDFVHFGSGVLSTEVFNTLIDSFKFTK